jgi:uncharacterized protein
MQSISARRTGFFLVGVVAVVAAVSACGATTSSSPSPAAPIASSAISHVASEVPTVSATPTPQPRVVELPTQLPDGLTFEQALPLFAYRGDRPFDVVVRGTQANASGTTVKDISYVGAAGEAVDAYLITPGAYSMEGVPAVGPFPGVLYVHGSGGSRVDFMYEATRVAEHQNMVGLVISRPVASFAADQATSAILDVREIRRALDLLASLADVDATRLGYVGHSMGAILGTVALSVDSRVKAAALMAVVPSYGSPSLDLAAFAPHITAPTVLLQFGTEDGYYTRDQGDRFAALIPATHSVVWYEAPHSLNAAAMFERDGWLATQLSTP